MIAATSTILLTTMLFMVYFLVSVGKTSAELSGWTPFITKLENPLGLDRHVVNFAAMLAIFIGARLRALQVDSRHGSPLSVKLFMQAYNVVQILAGLYMTMGLVPCVGFPNVFGINSDFDKQGNWFIPCTTS